MTASLPSHRHVIVYDGVCGLCNRFVQFTLKRDPDGRFAFATLQGEWTASHVAGPGVDPTRLETVYVLAEVGTDQERLLAHSDAALFVAGEIRGPWRLARVFRIVPRFLRDFVYRGVAKLRYRVFGRHDHCPVPPPAHRARFLDDDAG